MRPLHLELDLMKLQELLKFLNLFIKIYNPKSVLDYGCGTGILGIASKKFLKIIKLPLLI